MSHCESCPFAGCQGCEYQGGTDNNLIRRNRESTP